jgi:SAM-dependent methyltransferase
MDVRPYYCEDGASVAFYDLITAADPSIAGDIDLYASLIPPDGSLLELGSGTGRVSEAIARRGFDVTGLELSAAMIAQAEARRPPGLSLRYVQGDMRSFDLRRSFDAVICPYFVLSHMPQSEWKHALLTVSRHVQPKGVVAFHMPDRHQMAAPAPPPGALVFQNGPLSVFMDGKGFDGDRMDLRLRYTANGMSSVEQLTLFAGDLDGVADAVGLRKERDPVTLGISGRVHFYRIA